MTDDEMRAMPIPALQDEGLLFLWVTGRAMEVGRECMRVWGYTRVDEVIWVKTNQVHNFVLLRLFPVHPHPVSLLLATARDPHGSHGTLAEPHQGTHARWCEDRHR